MKQTQKSLLSLGVLLVVAGAVGGVAYWANKDEERKADEKSKSEKLFTLDKSRLRGLLLEKDGKLVAELSRDEPGKPWTLLRPVKDQADQAAVNALVDKLLELKQRKDLGSETDPKQPGLDAPRFKLAATLDDKTQQGVEIGADNPFDNSLYLRKLGEQTVRIVDGSAKSAFEKSTFDLRDKRVALLDDAAEVKSLTVSNDQPYTLTRQAGAWMLSGPGHEEPEKADLSTADRVVALTKGLRATGIAAETADAASLSKLGLADPALTLFVNEGVPDAAKDSARAVAIGQPEAATDKKKAYARRTSGGPIYEVDSQILKDLQKDWFQLQDKTVAALDLERVRMLEIDAPGAAKIIMSRKKEAKDGGAPVEEFAVEAPASGAAKKQKLTSALFALAGLRVAAFTQAGPKAAAEAKYGLQKPRVYTALGENGAVLLRVKLGGKVAGNDKRLYALADGARHIVEVEASAVSDLPKTLEDVLDVPPPAAGDGGTPPAQASAPKQ